MEINKTQINFINQRLKLLQENAQDIRKECKKQPNENLLDIAEEINFLTKQTQGYIQHEILNKNKRKK